VFVNMRGGAIGGSIFNKRHWQPARTAAGLDGLRFHDLRHTAVALAEISDVVPSASLGMVRDQDVIRDFVFSATAAAR
jgi:integrase